VRPARRAANATSSRAEPAQPAVQPGEQRGLLGIGQLAPRACERGLRGAPGAHELRPAAPAVVAVGGLPAVEVGHLELQLERERLARRTVGHLVEAVAERGHAAERDRDRDDRPQHGHRDRRVELGPDRHGAVPRAVAAAAPAGGRDPPSSGRVRAGYRHRPVILFVILGHVPTVLLIAQVGMLYLAWLDLRAEDDLDFQVKVWWLLLVLIFNVLGFLAEKLWIYERRRRRRAAAHDR
jgi:hypothetical protein